MFTRRDIKAHLVLILKHDSVTPDVFHASLRITGNYKMRCSQITPAIALVRYRFFGRGPLDFFVFLPLATPEVALGAALLGLFITMGLAIQSSLRCTAAQSVTMYPMVAMIPSTESGTGRSSVSSSVHSPFDRPRRPWSASMRKRASLSASAASSGRTAS